MAAALEMTLEQVQAASNRIGTNDRGEPARTFHLDFSSVKIGDDVTPRAALHYALREGKSSAAADDAVYVAGTARPVLEAADLIRQSARVKKGPNAERLLVKQIEELPSDTTRERWNDAAEALVADWAKRGHPAVAVVHLHGEESPHPHLHVLASARRIFEDEQGRPTVDRSRTLWSTRTELRDERQHVAGLINEACQPLVELNGGRLEHTNIHRPALTRVPLAAWHRRKQRERHPAKAAAAQMRARRRDVVARARPPRPPSRRAQMEKDLAAERTRADDAEAALENRQAGGNEPLQLTEQARAMLEGVCRRADVQLDLDTRAGQDIAFALRHIEEGRVSAGELADIRAAFGRPGSAEHAGDTPGVPAAGMAEPEAMREGAADAGGDAAADVPAPEQERSPAADVPPGDARSEAKPAGAGDAGDTIEPTVGVADHGDAGPGTAPGREEPPATVETGVLDDGRIFVRSPFDERFRAGARKLGGKWSRKERRWTFGADREEQVRTLCREVFGTDVTETPGTAPTAGLLSMDAAPEAAVSPADDVTFDEAAGTDVQDTWPESGARAQGTSISRAEASQAQPEQDAASGPGPADDDPDSRTAIGPARIEESAHDGRGTGEVGETHHDRAQGAGRVGTETPSREGKGTHRPRGAEQPRSGGAPRRDEADRRADAGGNAQPARDDRGDREDRREHRGSADGDAAPEAAAMEPGVVADSASPEMVARDADMVRQVDTVADGDGNSDSHRDPDRLLVLDDSVSGPEIRQRVLDRVPSDPLPGVVTPREPEPASSVPEASAPPQPPLEEDGQVQLEEAHDGAGDDASDYDWLMGDAGPERGQSVPTPGNAAMPEQPQKPVSGPAHPYAGLGDNALFAAYHASRKADGPQEERDAMRAEAARRRGSPEAPYAFHYRDRLVDAWRGASRAAGRARTEQSREKAKATIEATRKEAEYRGLDIAQLSRRMQRDDDRSL